MDRDKIINGEELDGTYEVCPHCGAEVKLDAELKVQVCPNCGKHIVPCSMCLALDSKQVGYCSKCCLCYLAEQENEIIAENERLERERKEREIDAIDREYEGKGIFQIVNEIDKFTYEVTGIFPTYRRARKALETGNFHNWSAPKGTGIIYFVPFYGESLSKTQLYYK